SEVLITLGIIGIVAALTMPTLINNANDRKYRGARQKALVTIGGAVRNITVTEGIGNSVDAEDFVENHLRKQIQIVKTCKNNNLRSCGIETNPNAITTLTEPKTKITMPRKSSDLVGYVSGPELDPNALSYGLVLSNGYSVNLFYNPICVSDNKSSSHYGQDRVCVNAVYDMNGLARPNEVGKDIGFVTVIYPDEKVVAYAPDVYKIDSERATFDEANNSCQNLDKNLFVPNRDELLAIAFNKLLLGIPSGVYWSSNDYNAGWAWTQNFGGWRSTSSKDEAKSIRCIQR
ncbi:MAG: hypothetical protein ACLSWI_02065, partial [Candidatus Gastranaerophilaceae bacterium]